MLKKFVWWFIVFGLSFLVQSWGWTDQGTAFLWIHLGGTVILLALIFLLCLFAGDGFGEKVGLSFIVAIVLNCSYLAMERMLKKEKILKKEETSSII